MHVRARGIRYVRGAALSLLLLAGCADEAPLAPVSGAKPAPARRPLGVMEITISGVGTATPSASALPIHPGGRRLAGGASYDLIPVGSGEESGIQLEPLAVGSFTDGDRASGGVRYLQASFRVRNASAPPKGIEDGVAYDTPRRNLTFLAVDTDGTLDETAFSQLWRFDGSAADPAARSHAVPPERARPPPHLP